MSSFEETTSKDVVKLTGCENESHIKDYIVLTGNLSTDPSNLKEIDRSKIKF